MLYGFGRGSGGRGGTGLGFRGTSPPWPYVGRGRGGLPRCQYPGLAGGTAVPTFNREQELGVLKSQAQALREQLEQIEARMKQMGEET